MKRFIKLLAVAVPVAWFQLPVMQERALSLSPISEAVAQTTHDTLASVSSSIGKPVVVLRNSTEDIKGMMEARILAGPVPAAFVTHTVVTPVPDGTPALAATHESEGGVGSASGGVRGVDKPAQVDIKAAVPASSAIVTRGPDVSASSASSASAVVAVSPPALAASASPDVFQQKKTVVLEGDSVMGEIAFSFQRFAAHHTDWTVINAHKVSSGLCNTEYYDWPKTARDLAKQYHPDIVLLTMGPNDGQDIYQPGKRLKLGSEAWHDEYVARFKTMVADAGSTGAKVYWFSVPVMRDASLESKMASIRKAQDDALAQLPQVTVIDETAEFRDVQGHFIEKGKVQGKLRTLRAGDGVHLTSTGADILVNALAERLAPPALTAAP